MIQQQLIKIGPKGQVLLKKEYRNKLNLHPGNYVEATLTPHGLLLRSMNARRELQKVQRLRASLSKRWNHSIDCVDAVREERR